VCHFKGGKSCSNVSSHGWTFVLAYVVFSISILNFLSLCESAVFSVATATVSLPLSGIWWSIYRMDVGLHGGKYNPCGDFASQRLELDRALLKKTGWKTGSISWSPGVTGELICALLGLPVVLLGLGLLVRSHFRDTQLPYQTIQPPDIQPGHEPCHR